MNLEKLSGIDFQINENELIYNKEEFDVAGDWTKPLSKASYAYKTGESEIDTLYFGARYMENNEDEETFKEYDYMADLTVINPGKVGEEFVKTVGHYHGNVPGQDIAYSEVYEAVTDNLEYLLQTEPDENGEVDVLWVVTTAGDKVVMMPGYGHVSMNVGSTPAIEIDVQKRDNPDHSDYSVFKEKVGGALYRTAEGLVKNPNYKIKSLRIVKPKEVPEWGLTKDVPLYTAITQNPEKFRFLTEPQNYEFAFDRFFEDAEL